MRLFVALQLSDSMKKALVGTMHEMKKKNVAGSYVPAQNLHITLAFIGETKEAEKVRQVLQQIPVEKSRLTFDTFGYFGDTMWIGVKGNQKIKKYVSDLRKTLKENGIPCDDSKFVPHVTLLRKLKGPRPSGLAVPEADMTVTKISLMKSETKDGKRVYTEIFSV